tara:strand:- start:195 stop:410 length:216 start_codon:yes stop_codon:yes gene_type:complete
MHFGKLKTPGVFVLIDPSYRGEIFAFEIKKSKCTFFTTMNKKFTPTTNFRAILLNTVIFEYKIMNNNLIWD